MIDIIKGTGIGGFAPGQKLTSENMNTLNDQINLLVNAVNALLRGTMNVNAENGNFETIYTLDTAIDMIPDSRRNLGLKLMFRDGRDSWGEYVYQGQTTKDEEWKDIKNWLGIKADIIDGGVW